MKKLHFNYRMDLKYTVPVNICYFTIKCFPCTDARQEVSGLQMGIIPECTWGTGKDGFGNADIYGKLDMPHDTFMFCVSGDVTIKQILYEEEADENRIGMFRYPHGLNRPGDALKQYFAGLSLAQYENPYEKAVMIMHRLHQDFSYQPGITGIRTTAEDAWKLGKGVCQDYAHIFIALCQMAGIPARYVTGMIMGEGASHAWVEILYHNKWIGLDPTNDILVADSHIKIGHGRDAGDCQINRGIMHGGGDQIQQISVSVIETGDDRGK